MIQKIKFFKKLSKMKINANILIVDDIEANLISLEYLLREYFDNINVIQAQSGAKALQIVLKEEIDLIILDIQMPEMDGFEVAKLLKSNKKTKDIPIIFLTAAFKEDEFQKRGFEVGAVDYLTKPIDNNQLVNKLKLYIEIFKKTKELQNANIVLKNALKENLRQKRILQTILDAEHSFVLVDDLENIFMLNKMLLDFFNVSSEKEFRKRYGCLLDQLIQLEDALRVEEIKKLSSRKERFEKLYELIENCDESKRVVKLESPKTGIKTFFINLAKKDEFYILNLTDITKMEKLHQETMKKAFYDNLTGVYNRNKLQELGRKAIEEALKQKKPLTCLMFDIDHFKRVNDTYGHLVGDEVLKKFASLIASKVHQNDILSRWGGEEFVLLLPNTNLQNAINIAENIRDTIASSEFEKVKKITTSIGVTQLKEGDTPKTLIERCDEALYLAKKNGRNRVEVKQ